MSEISLFDSQKALVRKMVEAVEKGCRPSFQIFANSQFMGVLFEGDGGLHEQIECDPADLAALSSEGITQALTRGSGALLPRAMKLVQSDFGASGNVKRKVAMTGKTKGPIFIGHGGPSDWKDLRDFIRDRLKLDFQEFNSTSTAGLSTKERLLEMLNECPFAFLVMTAEDETTDGKSHARANVIHEAGLFQGRYGFERAIILLEDGCEEFSNILGVGQIRFKRGDVLGVAEEIRRVLEREGLLEN